MAGSDTGSDTPTAAAAGYWRRRGLDTVPDQVVLAPGGPVLLLALLAAVGPGGVVLPRPCADWHLPQVRLLGRPAYPVPVPAECGGVPDSFALLETLRRARADGGDPRVLLLSVADDPTGTTAPPELLHEVCEVAAAQGLLIISDESWRDTSFGPRDTVIVSPVEMIDAPPGLPGEGEAVVLLDLGAALLPSGPAAAMARFPRTEHGAALGRAVSRVLVDLGAGLAEDARGAVTIALDEPESLRQERRGRARAHGTYAGALHHTLVSAGAVCRPPRVGRQLYADLEPLRRTLRARGLTESVTLEAELVRAVAGPWVRGGHWFGEPADALRVRVGTGMLAPPTPVRDPAAWDAWAAQRLERLTAALTGAYGDHEGQR